MNSATSILFITVRVFMKTLCCGKLGGMCVYVPNLMLLQWDCHCKYTKITYNHLPNNRLPFTFLINIKKIIYTNIVTWIWCIYRNGKIHIKVFKIIFNSIYMLQFKCVFNIIWVCFNCWKKYIMLTNAAFIWGEQITETLRNIIIIIIIHFSALKCILFLWCKAEFSASLIQSSVWHDPSEIILMLICCSRNVSYYY